MRDSKNRFCSESGTIAIVTAQLIPVLISMRGLIKDLGFALLPRPELSHLKTAITRLSLVVGLLMVIGTTVSFGQLPGPVPDDLTILHNGILWAWASPCAGLCSQPSPTSQEDWRYCTDGEFAARPSCDDFLRPDGSLRCASEYFDPKFGHCDFDDCTREFLTSQPNNTRWDSWFCKGENADSDGDGVLDDDDLCPDTVVPEATVPSKRLGTNRWALLDGDGVFDTTAPEGKGPGRSYNLDETRGCSCEQIIENVSIPRKLLALV